MNQQQCRHCKLIWVHRRAARWSAARLATWLGACKLCTAILRQLPVVTYFVQAGLTRAILCTERDSHRIKLGSYRVGIPGFIPNKARYTNTVRAKLDA